jgi:hypothetical protein
MTGDPRETVQAGTPMTVNEDGGATLIRVAPFFVHRCFENIPRG